MATGGGQGPWKATPREISQGEVQQDTEEDVAEAAEEVFCSYISYRYNQEMEEEDTPPADPEIEALRPDQNSSMCRVGRQLAIIGDDLTRSYDIQFTQFLSQLPLTPDNAYDFFCKIAKNLFDSGINWGRVIALLSFGYRMALHVFQQGMTGFLSSIARFITDFLLKNRIAQWIAQQGGWVAALELDNIYVNYMLAVLAVLLLGQFIYRRFFS